MSAANPEENLKEVEVQRNLLPSAWLLIPFRLNNSAKSKAVILLGLTRLRGVAPGRSDLRIAMPLHCICQLCTIILEKWYKFMKALSGETIREPLLSNVSLDESILMSLFL